MRHNRKTSKRTTKKDPNIYPSAWDAGRVKQVVRYYNRMKGRPVLEVSEVISTASRHSVSPKVSPVSSPAVFKARNSHGGSVTSTGKTVSMDIPQDLVPDVPRLIQRKRKTA
jgi:hypothetical protein